MLNLKQLLSSKGVRQGIYRVTFTLALFMSVFALSAFTTSAHASAHANVIRPNASGGGCYTDYSDPNSTVGACISYSWPNVNSDAYITFNPSEHIDSCTVNVAIEDLHAGGSWVAFNSYNCLSNANNHARNVHYGVVSYFTLYGSYRTKVQLFMTNNNGADFSHFVSSPDQDV